MVDTDKTSAYIVFETFSEIFYLFILFFLHRFTFIAALIFDHPSIHFSIRETLSDIDLSMVDSFIQTWFL